MTNQFFRMLNQIYSSIRIFHTSGLDILDRNMLVYQTNMHQRIELIRLHHHIYKVFQIDCTCQVHRECINVHKVMQSIINQIIRLLEIYSAMIRNDEVVIDKLLNRPLRNGFFIKEEMIWSNFFVKPNNEIPHDDIERQIHDG